MANVSVCSAALYSESTHIPYKLNRDLKLPCGVCFLAEKRNIGNLLKSYILRIVKYETMAHTFVVDIDHM